MRYSCCAHREHPTRWDLLEHGKLAVVVPPGARHLASPQLAAAISSAQSKPAYSVSCCKVVPKRVSNYCRFHQAMMIYVSSPQGPTCARSCSLQLLQAEHKPHPSHPCTCHWRNGNVRRCASEAADELPRCQGMGGKPMKISVIKSLRGCKRGCGAGKNFSCSFFVSTHHSTSLVTSTQRACAQLSGGKDIQR